MAQTKLEKRSTFQSTPSLRKVTTIIPCLSSCICYFNPHLPCGRWLWSPEEDHTWFYFNPHLPCGRWPQTSFRALPSGNFNPHLPCGRWLFLVTLVNFTFAISIHTFLAEGDELELVEKKLGDIFQSTPSLRKVTVKQPHPQRAKLYFNPHLPCGRWRPKLIIYL